MGLADGLVSLLHDPNPLLNNDFRALEQLGISELKLVVNNAISSYRRKFIRHIMDQLEAHRPPATPPVQIPYDTEDPE
jgi:precorrin-3B methylase